MTTKRSLSIVTGRPAWRGPILPATEALPLNRTCQKCTKRHETTRARTIYTKRYEGPCGDSFCYASCDLEACRPVAATLCDPCAKKLAR